MEINFYNRSAAEQDKSFLVQQFFKNAAEGLGRARLILRQDSARRISCATLRFDRCCPSSAVAEGFQLLGS
jgi:hypothetical protein